MNFQSTFETSYDGKIVYIRFKAVDAVYLVQLNNFEQRRPDFD